MFSNIKNSLCGPFNKIREVIAVGIAVAVGSWGKKKSWN
jgi:hypothetical protein